LPSWVSELEKQAEESCDTKRYFEKNGSHVSRENAIGKEEEGFGMPDFSLKEQENKQKCVW
jgi:uncharacterized protein YkuJ